MNRRLGARWMLGTVVACLAAGAPILAVLAGWIRWPIAAATVAFIAASIGAVATAAVVLARRRRREGFVPNPAVSNDWGAAPTSPPARRAPAVRCKGATAPTGSAPRDADGLVELMVRQHRYVLLLRPQLLGNLSQQQRSCVLAELTRNMAVVPAGEVRVYGIDDILDTEEDEFDSVHGALVEIEPLLIDRYPVTNSHYFEFVAAGAYDDASIWDEAMHHLLGDLVDATGYPGPAFWRRGEYPSGEQDYPVIGVSWYEAVAYARWAGKHLPSDAQWVRAASCSVTSVGARSQRRYPWGNLFEPQRANLWGTGPGTVLPVDGLHAGATGCGVHQLIGNVWEWIADPFGIQPGTSLVLEGPMRSLRGGAFDTYFSSQASADFQTGDTPLARKQNIGFRCVVPLCELAPEAADHVRSGRKEVARAAPLSAAVEEVV